MKRILTLLIVTQVTAEWVEISQQYYRKPIRTHSLFTTRDKEMDVEDTTRPWSYNNWSMTEYNWNTNPARLPNVGNVKRVQHIVGSTVKTNERVKSEDEDLELDVDMLDYELRPNYNPTSASVEHGKQKGTIKRVPNLGNIKRVQLSNSPVKSPAANFMVEREKNSNYQYDDHRTEINDFEHIKNKETFNRRINLNKVIKHGTDRTDIFSMDDDDKDTSFAEEVIISTTIRSKQEYKYEPTTRPKFITETEGLTTFETQQNRFYKITNNKSSDVTEKNTVFTAETMNTDYDIVTKTNTKLTKPTTENTFKNDVRKNSNDDEGSHESNINLYGNNVKQTNINVNEYKIKMKGNNARPLKDHQSKNEYDKEIVKAFKSKLNDSLTSTKPIKNKVNTLENVIKFMRVVADTISRNSRRSFGGKIQYLHELKDSILANIEERIDATWPDDDSAGARRRSRSANASPRGHVQFPSSESALMTISFLTFAVFLIKLVLQVIQTYKHKAMIMAPVMVASGRNVFTHHHGH